MYQNQAKLYCAVVKINQQHNRAMTTRNSHKSVLQAIENPMILNKPTNNVHKPKTHPKEG
jgi:hypothetical protein